ncbi:MAG: hypothetical protein QHG98_07415 [Methanothrix sp.]|jgi:hypothetical protein|nr:hypothetical protein [Methanothrix sp.]
MGLMGTVAGDFKLGGRCTAFLYEGAVTPAEMEDNFGNYRPAVTRAAPIKEGDLVELFDDTAITYEATCGLPVVRKIGGAAGSAYVGRVLNIEKAEVLVPPTQVSALSDLIAMKLLRVATVEFAGMDGMTVIEATVPANVAGADSIDIGNPATLIYDKTAKKWKFGNGSGSQFVPMTHLEGSTSTDVTGPVLLGIGLVPVEIV